MSFDAVWLELREPADRAARDPGLLAAAAGYLGEALALDLGCGTGATVRAFGGVGRWRLVDADPALLEIAGHRCPEAEVVRADLADLDGLALEGVRLVTASALFDLAGEAWIRGLVRRVAVAGVGLYAALSYDGGLAWEPAMPGDRAVAAAFDAHQRRDKGLGPALGPEAVGVLAAALGEAGYAVRVAASPWRLGPGALQAALVDGIAGAAAETGCAAAAAWGQARRAASGSARCTVGHLDVLALPQGASAQSKTTSLSRP